MSDLGRRLGAALRFARHPTRLGGVLLPRVMSHRKLREVLYRYVGWRDRRQMKGAGFAHLPPAPLRFRVHGDLDLHSFLQSGRQCSQDIRAALARIGQDPGSFHQILDFGCGCGRTIIWFLGTGDSIHLSGTDIDVAAIDWCRTHLDAATFEVNPPLPPLPYEANSFDFVYAISVFTHLKEDYQFRWLGELRRVTQSKGYVLLTLHGSYYWSRMRPQAIEEIKQRGFMFLEGARSMEGLFPEWYQNAYHTQEYVFSRYSEYFDILEYIPHGLDSCQDIVLLQKP